MPTVWKIASGYLPRLQNISRNNTKKIFSLSTDNKYSFYKYTETREWKPYRTQKEKTEGKPKMTYAQASRNSVGNNKDLSTQHTKTHTNQTIAKVIHTVRIITSKHAEQMSTLMNLLTTEFSKTSKINSRINYSNVERNGRTQRIKYVEVLLNTQQIDILLVSETHFRGRKYTKIPNYAIRMGELIQVQP
jgi:hypothetical protein